MSKKAPTVIEALTGNKKTEFGVLFFILALILGLFSIYAQTESYSEEGRLESDNLILINRPRLNARGTLYLNYTNSAFETDQVRVSVLDRNKEVINSTFVGLEDNETLNLNTEAIYFRKEEGSGSVDYSYCLYYSTHPYRLFAIPTLILTALGVILVYKGFDEYMDTLSKSGKSSESYKEGKEHQDIDFMGVEKKKEEE
ncbi:hypothetical protein AKJ64_05155 [candidate division MSBL1 archaeon SCGC-AAA259E17]|uniref:Uncharacterized protein n=1 Tax=candidate division MSBL1 archaeon SCGC-AAA259E17 TaxID=1698263 RepID=A0A133U9M6_9EURY|nr:hypothetical protein AKJ64_05155 [candidate division MSBL1 archaeon SCGC-AAA259E17]